MIRTRPFAPYTPARVRLDDGTERDVPETMSAAEFMAMPWPEKQHWELIWGCPVMSPAPVPFHQDMVIALIRWIGDLLDDRRDFKMLQDEDVLLPGAENYLRPDIAVFRRAEIDMSRVPVRALPPLIVEVLSPSTAGLDWGDKKVAYAEAGVSEYWIADPASCSLAVLVNPDRGEYSQIHADGEGMVRSPFFDRRLKLEFDGQDYRVRSA
jgi:Uma2 family endonuclease